MKPCTVDELNCSSATCAMQPLTSASASPLCTRQITKPGHSMQWLSGAEKMRMRGAAVQDVQLKVVFISVVSGGSKTQLLPNCEMFLLDLRNRVLL